MAGDWIKMRTGLLNDPKAKALADAWERSERFEHDWSAGALGECYVARNALRFAVTGALHAVWSSVNEHGNDGFVSGAKLDWINDIVGIGDFAGAMKSVGWVEETKGGLSFPKFDRNNTCGAERQKRYRENKKRTSDASRNDNASVTRSATGDVTGDSALRPREEKRREEVREGVPSCSEPEVPASKQATDEAFAENFPPVECVGPVKSWRMTTAKLFEWRESFSTLDVDMEIRKAYQWLRDNRTKRKTADGMTKFIGAWLTRATNERGGKASGTATPVKVRNPPQPEGEPYDPAKSPLARPGLGKPPFGWQGGYTEDGDYMDPQLNQTQIDKLKAKIAAREAERANQKK